MIGSILIQFKKYGFLDFLSAVVLSIGLINFILADISVAPSFDFRGIALISTALVADACVGNVQEYCLKTLKYEKIVMIANTFGYGCVLVFSGLVVTGQIIQDVKICMEYPFVFTKIFFYALTGYIGLQFVLETIKNFGAFLTVVITTCRKAVSIILSFILFDKPFVMQYLYSGLVVVLGIFLNVLARHKSKLSDRWKLENLFYEFSSFTCSVLCRDSLGKNQDTV